MHLVLVESGTKAKPIEKYLNSVSDIKVVVKATFGHFRDLPKKKLGISDDFVLTYEIKNKKVVKELTSLVDKVKKSKGMVILAADKDREGEAIAQSIVDVFDLPQTSPRMIFTEITKGAIIKAFQNMTRIDESMVQAQEARRIVDRILGWKLCPMLWQKFPEEKSLSAGRTQSVILKLICDLEDKIKAFVPDIFYSLKAKFPQLATWHVNSSPKLQVDDPKSLLTSIITSTLTVHKAKTSKKFVKAPLPFMTATVQQESRTKLNLPIKQTQAILQKLYEKGLITYIRTDTTNMSPVFQEAVKQFITENISDPVKWLSTTLKTTKAHGPGMAHECIRPTNILTFSSTLEGLEMKVYDLIWKRTVAAMMSDKVLDVLSFEIVSSNFKYEDGHFKGKIDTVCFPGWSVVYAKPISQWHILDTVDELPKMEENGKIKMNSVEMKDEQTKPPVRFSDALLVKKMQQLEIGRPSTYVPSVQKNLDRGYVKVKTTENQPFKASVYSAKKPKWEIKHSKKNIKGAKHKNRLQVTVLGMKVNNYLQSNFSDFIQEKYTKDLEKGLDKIAHGKMKRNTLLENFNITLESLLQTAKTSKPFKQQHREVGMHKNMPVVVYKAKYGPVLKWNGKFFKLVGDPETVSKEDAMKQFNAGLNKPKPKVLGIYRKKNVLLCKGKYGFYVRYGTKIFSAQENTCFEDAKKLLTKN